MSDFRVNLQFDKMSTSDLEEILRNDFESPENEGLDPETILKITEVIAQRCEYQGSLPDINAALITFREKYLESSNEGESLYALEEEKFPVFSIPKPLRWRGTAAR